MKNVFYTTLIIVTVFISGCKKEEIPITACINPSAVSAKIGELITFTSCTINATSYTWSFGDGTTSAEASPKHAYATPGTYTVTLTAKGNNGADTKTIVITITSASQNFVGDFNVTDNCSSGVYTYEATITVFNGNTINIQNFGGFGTTTITRATVSGSNITIPTQSVTWATFSGSGTIDASLNYITITYNETSTSDNCTATFIRK